MNEYVNTLLYASHAISDFSNAPIVSKCRRTAAQCTNGNSSSIGWCRRMLPQVLACFVMNLLVLNHGMAVSVEYLLDRKVPLWIDPAIIFVILILCIPFGWICDQFGRKSCIYVAHALNVLVWLCLSCAASLTIEFEVALAFGAAYIFTRLSMALAWAPLIAYLHEISEYSIRMTMLATLGVAWCLGNASVTTFKQNGTDVRFILLFCVMIPVAAMLISVFIPESPIWLLSKKRNLEALRALQWLQGWVSDKTVIHEFGQLQRLREQSQSCLRCRAWHLTCLHPKPSVFDKLRSIGAAKILRPLLLIAILCFIGECNRSMAYVDDAMDTAVYKLIISCLFVGVVWLIGSRMTLLWAYFGLAINYLIIGYFDLDRQIGTSTSSDSNLFDASMPLLLQHYSIMHIIRFVPIVLIGDMFPFKSRSFTTVILMSIGGIFHCLRSIASDSFGADIRVNWPLHAGIYGLIGCIVVLLWLPDGVREITTAASENSSYQQQRIMNADIHTLVYGIQWPVDRRPAIMDTLHADVL